MPGVWQGSQQNTGQVTGTPQQGFEPSASHTQSRRLNHKAMEAAMNRESPEHTFDGKENGVGREEAGKVGSCE